MGSTDVQTIGKYQVIERIARGDLAEIFLARLEGIGGFKRLFAIKRVLPHLARLESYAQMIEEEARLAGILSHGNIVQLLDLGREDGVLYLVMEYIDGWDLGAVLSRTRRDGLDVPVDHVVFLGMQLLKGLEYAHSRVVVRDGDKVDLDLVHRDVSPSNILLSRQGDVKLTDFGIARASLKMMQTHPDLVARRFDYISPEQARGGDIDQRSDLWAVGVVLYETLTLTHPFKRQGELETLEAIRDGDYRPIGELRQGVHEGLVGVIEAALSVDPEARPISATEFKDALAGVRMELGRTLNEDSMASWLEKLFAAEDEEDEEEASVEAPAARLAAPRPAGMDVDPEDAQEDVLAELPEASESSGVVPALDEDESRTVVEAAPAVKVAEMARNRVAVPPKPADWEEDAATIVNRDLASRLEDLKSFKESDAAEEEATRVRSDALRKYQMVAAASPAAPEGTPWVAGAVSAGLMLVMGVLLGAVLMIMLGRSSGMTVNPPMLDVRGAPDLRMTVTVDGHEIRGPQELEPGQHRLRVDVAGTDPWEVDLSLQAGEYRLMMIEADRVGSEPTP